MKQKDLVLIGGVIVISTVFALILSSVIIGSPSKNPQQAEVVDVITTNFPPPSKAYYNNTAIDPTKLITIGTNANPDPFNGPAKP